MLAKGCPYLKTHKYSESTVLKILDACSIKSCWEPTLKQNNSLTADWKVSFKRCSFCADLGDGRGKAGTLEGADTCHHLSPFFQCHQTKCLK